MQIAASELGLEQRGAASLLHNVHAPVYAQYCTGTGVCGQYCGHSTLM